MALDASGTANLGGTLSGALLNLGSGAFVPRAGDSFEILTATGGINGTFDEGGSLPPLTGDLYWDVVYDTENGRVLMDVLTPHTADFDGNGMVDGDDLGFWHDALTLFVHDEADADGDGDTDGNDFLIWQRQVGSGVGASAVAVPEPCSILLLLATSACSLPWRRVFTRSISSS